MLVELIKIVGERIEKSLFLFSSKTSSFENGYESNGTRNQSHSFSIYFAVN